MDNFDAVTRVATPKPRLWMHLGRWCCTVPRSDSVTRWRTDGCIGVGDTPQAAMRDYEQERKMWNTICGIAGSSTAF
jgi:hypothetical protein